MVKYNEVFHSDFSKEELFDLVMDVEKYPEFLPWCAGCRIIEKNNDKIIAELLVRFSNFTESYVSEITFTKPDNIYVQQISGPFKVLTNKWFFEKEEKNTKIIFEIEFEFKSKIFEKLMGSYFKKASHKMSSSFIKRAGELYGKLK